LNKPCAACPFEGHLPLDNGRAILAGDHKPTHVRSFGTQAVTSDVKTDSSATRQYGFNGASSSEVPRVEIRFIIAHGPANAIVLERTIDRQQRQSNPNTTIKHIKLTTV
jgi:hypothetical protein